MSGLAPWLSNTEFSVTMNNIGDDGPPIYLSGGGDVPNNGGATIMASGSTLGRYTVVSFAEAILSWFLAPPQSSGASPWMVGVGRAYSRLVCLIT